MLILFDAIAIAATGRNVLCNFMVKLITTKRMGNRKREQEREREEQTRIVNCYARKQTSEDKQPNQIPTITTTITNIQ